MATDLEIVCVPALSDNYVWLIHDPVSTETVVVDPSEAEPVLATVEQRGWTISQIWNTHWHGDHTGGNAAIKALGAKVSGPLAEADRIPTLDTGLREGDSVQIGAHVARVMETPGHTAGHIVFHMADDALLFKFHDSDHSVAWRTPHTAFWDTSFPDRRPRESVELRSMAFFE